MWTLTPNFSGCLMGAPIGGFPAEWASMLVPGHSWGWNMGSLGLKRARVCHPLAQIVCCPPGSPHGQGGVAQLAGQPAVVRSIRALCGLLLVIVCKDLSDGQD